MSFFNERNMLALKMPRVAASFRHKSPEFWQRKGETMALSLFRLVAQQVPAYRDFLRKHRVRPEKIKTAKDFAHLPPMDKKEYLRAYPLKDLVFPQKLQRLHTISASSGSTGNPFFWPRGDTQEWEGAFFHELLFREIFGITPRTSALCVVSFSMGTWIAGTYTLASVKKLSRKGYSIDVITPGIDQETLFDLLPALLPEFHTLIFCGYPPYLKDILDEAERRRIRFPQSRTKFLLAGEGMTEAFRDYIVERGGGNPFFDVISLYGTADAAILAHETPLSIFLRKELDRNAALRKTFFGTSQLPSFLQYHPHVKFFETLGDELLFTTAAGIPLIRYRIGDRGGIFSFREVRARFQGKGARPFERFPHKKFLWNLPFVYLFGRADLTVTLYGLLIYPENIKAALDARPLARFLTGKFTMATAYDKKQHQYLDLHIELKPGLGKSKKNLQLVAQEMLRSLLARNIEFRKLYHSLGERVTPHVSLEAYGNPRYFARGAKQPWIKKA